MSSVYENITTQEKCQDACLTSPFRCFSYDFGDSLNKKVCRLGYLDLTSLSHIDEPYLELKGAVMYQRTACYNGN